jgi:isoleucyl-tRNA synthetase
LGEMQLTDICLVSHARLEKGEGQLEVEAKPCGEPKCPRCWRLGHGIGADPKRPELCARCAAVIAAK